MKDEIGGKIMKEYVAPMPKTGSYFTGNRSFKKRKKGYKEMYYPTRNKI